MFINYLKTAWRNLIKNKGFTALNGLGLTLGIATCLLIVFYVLDELSYDRYNENADRIYRINNLIKFGGNEGVYASSPAPVAQTLKNDFPEIDHVVRLQNAGRIRVKKGNGYIREDHAVYADSSLFTVFTLPLIEGKTANALKNPNSVVITEQIAKKYFNRTDVVGRTLLMNDNEPYQITGVMKDIPVESHFRFDFFFAMSGFPASREEAWLSNNFVTYVLLKPGADPRRLEAKFPGFHAQVHGSAASRCVACNIRPFRERRELLPFRPFPINENPSLFKFSG